MNFVQEQLKRKNDTKNNLQWNQIWSNIRENWSTFQYQEKIYKQVEIQAKTVT